ncbi:MAG: DUF3006 domain-containing protein [Clostridia bacterium]|nr:DUF3006 domain-containing protein [Clostridia bacterium]
MSAPNDSDFYVIDRAEEGRFVLVGSGGQRLSGALLPEGAREGDVVRCTAEGWVLCPQQTAVRRERLAQKKRSIFEKR